MINHRFQRIQRDQENLSERRLDLIRPLVLLPIVILFCAALVAAGLFAFGSGAGVAMQKVNEKLIGDQGPVIIPPFAERSTILAADGSTLATVYGGENRTYVPLSDVAPLAWQAVLAIEDHSFYDHGPVNFPSIMRAAIANLVAGKIVQGGSTITQQLVKQTVTGSAETFQRKFLEAQEAIRLERQYSKDQILELYLNEIPLGHGTYGIGAASEYYFAKEPGQLGLAQSALLAGLIAAPSRFDPVEHPTSAVTRRNEVLGRMLDLGWISQEQYDTSSSVRIKLSAKMRNGNQPGPEPYFVEYVKQEILHDPRYFKVFGKTYDERYKSLFQGGLTVYTTLDPTRQDEARASIESHLPNQGPTPPKDPEAAVVTVVPKTGAIQVMACGVNFATSKVNLCASAQRSTGSAFKAFTLVAAMEQGVPAGRVYESRSPIFIPECNDWHVRNAEPGLGGYMDLWSATRLSVNVVFAQLIRDIGPQSVFDAAAAMGLPKDEMTPVCSMTLGGGVGTNALSMSSAYSTLANGGVHCVPYAISKVVDRSGKVIFRAKPDCKQAISPQVASQVTAMLEGVVSGGTGHAADIGRPQAGKTGTGQTYQDAWFMGYIPQLCTGVWVGYSKAEIPMEHLPVIGYQNAFGGTIAAPIWHDYMIKAVQGMPVVGFPAPPPQRSGTIPDVTGMQQQQAEDTLVKANFTPIVQQVDAVDPAGTVVSQDPVGGTVKPLGFGVTINVSTGKAPKVSVPDVVGKTEANATKTLTSAGFVVKVVYQTVGDPNQVGKVLSQTPAAGSSKKVGSTVTIVVGQLGPTPTPTPGGKG